MNPKRLLTVASLAVVLTACSTPDSGADYTAPDNICGIPADKEILGSLLHSGKKLEQDSGTRTLKEGQFCHLYVDGNDSVTSDANWQDSRYSLDDTFRDYDVKNLRYFGSREFVSWNSGVATVFSCPGVSDDGDKLALEVSDIRWNKNSQELLEKLMPAYTQAYKKKLGCPAS